MASYDTAKLILTRALPSAVLRSQSRGEWGGDFPLPDAVAEYFTEFGPVDVTIDGYGNPYFLPSLSHLWEHQLGYRFHPRTRERIPDWDDDWLVIADEGGDPFIFSRSRSAILHAYHGEGVWEPEQIFGNIGQMATTLAIIGDIVSAAGEGLTDADSRILPIYREEALVRITEAVRSPERAHALVSRLGWA